MRSNIRGFVPLIILVTLLAACERPRYDPARDAATSFTGALTHATDAGRYLMDVFGADWCSDCRKLYENLNHPDVRAYMGEHMDYLTVDVGDKDRNLEFASSLGVSIDNGIPVAVFFDPTGSAIGTTNQGQLEPARSLTSRQILRFVNTVVDERTITRPVPPARNLENEA